MIPYQIISADLEVVADFRQVLAASYNVFKVIATSDESLDEFLNIFVTSKLYAGHLCDLGFESLFTSVVLDYGLNL